jgi:hypothetical protein
MGMGVGPGRASGWAGGAVVRDPRQDPRPKDVLTQRGGRDLNRIEVLSFDGFEVRFRRSEGRFGRDASTFLDAWRLHHADDEVLP